MAAVLDCGTQILAISAQRDIAVDSEQFQQMRGQVDELAADRIPPPGVLLMPQVWLVSHVILYADHGVHIHPVHQHCLNVVYNKAVSLRYVTPEKFNVTWISRPVSAEGRDSDHQVCIVNVTDSMAVLSMLAQKCCLHVDLAAVHDRLLLGRCVELQLFTATQHLMQTPKYEVRSLTGYVMDVSVPCIRSPWLCRRPLTQDI